MKIFNKKTIITTLALVLVIIFLIFSFMLSGGNKLQELTPEQQKAKEVQQGIDSTREAIRYENKKFGFSFEKPEGFSIGSFSEGETGETIVVQNTNSDVKKSGFQIFVNPIPAGISLTPDFIKEDLPGTEVSDPKKILLDGKGEGIMFLSNSESFDNKSREIWFVYDGYVYQVTSYREFGSELERIIGTWRFE